MNSNKRNRGEHDSFSIVDTLFYPYTAVRDWFSDALSGDDRIRDPDGGPFSAVVSILTLPFRLLFAFAVFMVQAWSTSRKGRAFVLGIPAVAVVVLSSITFWGVTFYYNKLTLGRTFSYYKKALRQDEVDPERVLIFAKKRAALQPEDEELKYNLGVALEADGQHEKALSLMKELAPVDAPGYVNAHLWLARNYQQEQIKSSEKEKFDDLSAKHLEMVVKEDPSNLSAQMSLASQYQIRSSNAKIAGDDAESNKNLEQAEKALENVINPMFAAKASERQMSIAQILQIPRLLSIKRALGNEAGAMEKFDELFDDVLKKTQNFPDDIRLKIFVALRDSAISVKDYDRAVKIMQQAFQTFDNSKLKQAFVRSSAQLLLLKADQHLDFDDREDFLAHVDAVSRSLNANPAEREAYKRLLNVIAKLRGSDQNLVWLKESLLNSSKLSLTHLLIGFNMISEGDIQDGKSHWKIAFRLERIAQTILNNIIDVASSDKEGRVENMLDVNLIALEMFDQPMLYQSLGMNHFHNNNIEEAIKNFEITLELQPTLIRSHYHLVECYEALGNTEKAAFHQKKLDEFFAKLPPNQRDKIKNRMKNL